jgi:hypothetical protein
MPYQYSTKGFSTKNLLQLTEISNENVVAVVTISKIKAYVLSTLKNAFTLASVILFSDGYKKMKRIY